MTGHDEHHFVVEVLSRVGDEDYGDWFVCEVEGRGVGGVGAVGVMIIVTIGGRFGWGIIIL